MKFLIYALYVAKLRLIIYRFKIDDLLLLVYTYFLDSAIFEKTFYLGKKWVIQEYISCAAKMLCVKCYVKSLKQGFLGFTI